MTDKEALDIICNKNIDDIGALSEAIYIAAKRLEECQWHDYAEDDYRLNLATRVILGIRYDDGSRGSVDGCVMYDIEKGHYLVIDRNHRNHFNENAVIEKWMKYPDYTIKGEF